jgi:hypothetical protein
MNLLRPQSEIEKNWLELDALRREAYAAQQEVIAASPFVKLSSLIANGNRFSHHWKKMKKQHGDIAVKYQVSYNAWGNKRGYVSSVESEDGRKWRGTEGRSMSGDLKAGLRETS